MPQPYVRCTAEETMAAHRAIANRLRPQLNGPRLGRAVNADRVACAHVIIETVKRRGLAQRAAVIAVTTAITESELLNVTHGDRDSLGLFQQRPSQGWGTPAQVMDPIHATNAFLNAMLRKYPDNSWMSGPIGPICQRVQVSGDPGAYALEVHDAQLLVDILWTDGSQTLERMVKVAQCVVPGTQILQLFYRGADNAAWTQWRNPDGSWARQQSLGGRLT